MRVLRVYPFLPPLPGGMEKHVCRLSQEQRLQGHDVVIAFNCGQPSAKYDLKILNGVNLRAIRPQFLRDAVFYTVLVAKLMLRRSKFDVLHVHGDWSAFWMARIVAMLVDAPISIATVHGNIRRKYLLQSALRHYDQVYFTGAREYAEMHECINTDVFWQPSGIDPCFFELPGGDGEQADVISVCNLLPVKNVQLILDVAKKLPSYRFRIVGDGPLRAKLEMERARRELTNVDLLGRLEAAEVAKCMSESKVLLVTSIFEGTPTVIMEAMACGLPVVATDCNDLSAILEDGENGYVVSTWDVDSLALKLRSLLVNRELRRSICINNRQKAISYQWPGVAQVITSRVVALHE